MKSIKILATVGAIALLGMTGLSSCKTNNGPEDPGQGNYSGETVKTEFMINIADGAAGKTNRWDMPGTTVQADHSRTNFRGMDSIRLVPYGATVDNRIGKTIVLSPIASGTSGLHDKGNSKLYSNVAIPIGTENFLFYGKAVDNNNPGTPASTVEAMHQYGTINVHDLYTSQPEKGNIYFDLVPIYSTGAIDPKATALVEFLNHVATASITSPAAATWKDNANVALDSLYKNFITLKAGSSYSVLQTVNDLYNTLNRFRATQIAASAADNMAKAILDSIALHTELKASGPNAYQDTLKWIVAQEATYANFPGNINLPEGAAVVNWDGTKFATVVASNINGLTTNALNMYCYPSSLQYFIQSGIKTSKTSKASLYDDSHYWKDILEAYEGDGKVYSSTKSVAIEDTIQYGVGQLAVTVKLANTTLKDQTNEDIDFSGAKDIIKWNGVLVGEQKQVDYKFEVNDGQPAMTIYDNYLNGQSGINQPITLTTSVSATNYTLVFSTKDNTGKDHKVPVAIELVNGNKAFHGVNGQLIPPGGTFYLVGMLDAGHAAEPGYAISGGHPANWNIFYKDYATKANFTITSVKNAYYTIPDLRSTDLELGFSVDLVWEEGIIFDIDL